MTDRYHQVPPGFGPGDVGQGGGGGGGGGDHDRRKDDHRDDKHDRREDHRDDKHDRREDHRDNKNSWVRHPRARVSPAALPAPSAVRQTEAAG